MNFYQLKNAYSRKNLLWVFAITDLKLRYKNSVLGFFWSFLEPLLLLAVLYGVFTYVFTSQIPNYPLYLLLGIIIWNSFTRGTMMSMNSITGRSGVISTIYFPKIILPISANLTSIIMMGFEFGVFVLFMIVFQFFPPLTILLLAPLLFLLFMFNIGIGFSLSVLFVKYKDLIHIWQVITYAGFFFTPIIYSLEIFPDEIKNLILLNPVAQIIEMSHGFVLYELLPSYENALYTIGICITVFFVGLIVFNKMERTITDEL